MEQTADRVVIINQGRLVREGTIEELSRGRDRQVIVRSPHAARFAEALRAKSAIVHATGPNELRVTGLDAPDVGRLAFAEQVELHALETERSDLEEIFLALTRTTPEPDVSANGGEQA